MALTIRQATWAFVNGFSFTRSYTWPCRVLEHGPLLIMRDAPRRQERSAEVVVPDVPVDRVQEALRTLELPRRYALSAIVASPGIDRTTRDAYKEIGFRLGRSEGMFIYPLDRSIPARASTAEVRRVTTQEEVESLDKYKRTREMLPEHVGDPAEPVRLYIALQGEEIVGWVKSIDAQHGCRWVSNMYVRPEFRRQGIAAHLMTEMLRDDAEAGGLVSVLLASHTGAMLYDSIGYDRIGTLHLFNPCRTPSFS